MKYKTNWLKDMFSFILIMLFGETSPIWREFRATRQHSRAEISLTEAYAILYGKAADRAYSEGIYGK